MGGATMEKYSFVLIMAAFLSVGAAAALFG